MQTEERLTGQRRRELPAHGQTDTRTTGRRAEQAHLPDEGPARVDADRRLPQQGHLQSRRREDRHRSRICWSGRTAASTPPSSASAAFSASARRTSPSRSRSLQMERRDDGTRFTVDIVKETLQTAPAFEYGDRIGCGSRSASRVGATAPGQRNAPERRPDERATLRRQGNEPADALAAPPQAARRARARAGRFNLRSRSCCSHARQSRAHFPGRATSSSSRLRCSSPADARTGALLAVDVSARRCRRQTPSPPARQVAGQAGARPRRWPSASPLRCGRRGSRCACGPRARTPGTPQEDASTLSACAHSVCTSFLVSGRCRPSQVAGDRLARGVGVGHDERHQRRQAVAVADLAVGAPQRTRASPPNGGRGCRR